MKVRDLEQMLLTLTSFGATELDQRTRRLREMGALPVGGRGRHAPDISPEHAAVMVLALAAAKAPGDTQQAVETYGQLKAADASFQSFETVAAALAGMLRSIDVVQAVESITVCRTWPEVRIRYTELGKTREAVYRFPDATLYPVREEICINGSLLAQIHVAINVPTRSGWVER